MTISKLKVSISGRVLVNNSASDTPLNRSTFLLTLKESVIFSCFPFDLATFAAGFLGSDLLFLFLPLTGAKRQKDSTFYSIVSNGNGIRSLKQCWYET